MKRTTAKNVDKDLEQKEFPTLLVRLYKLVRLSCKVVWQYLQKQNICVVYNPATLFLGMYPANCLCLKENDKNFHNGIFCKLKPGNIQDVPEQ